MDGNYGVEYKNLTREMTEIKSLFWIMTTQHMCMGLIIWEVQK